VTFEFDARNLAFRMNAGVSSSRPMNSNAAAVQQRQHSRQFTLYGAQPVLDLPTVKFGPVVLKQKFEVHESVSSEQ